MNLSDKWKYCHHKNEMPRYKIYTEKDVKEFIKKLKEEMIKKAEEWGFYTVELMELEVSLHKIIDKLAGKELTND